MIRATTPTHTFKFTVNPNTFDKVQITYKQGSSTTLTKNKSDITFRSEGSGSTTVWYGYYKLTQAETKLFNTTDRVQIQVRILTTDADALASNIMELSVSDVLDDTVLTPSE